MDRLEPGIEYGSAMPRPDIEADECDFAVQDTGEAGMCSAPARASRRVVTRSAGWHDGWGKRAHSAAEAPTLSTGRFTARANCRREEQAMSHREERAESTVEAVGDPRRRQIRGRSRLQP